MNTDEVAEFLGIDVCTVYDYVTKEYLDKPKEVPFLGKRTRYYWTEEQAEKAKVKRNKHNALLNRSPEYYKKKPLTDTRKDELLKMAFPVKR